MPHKVQCVLRDGSIMRIDPRDDFEWLLFNARQYEPATLELFDQVLRPGDVMVDAGANIGLMSLHAGRCVGSDGMVIAFEPHGGLFSRLQEHIALNGLANILALNVALGSMDDSRVLFEVPSVSIGRGSLVDPGPEGRPAGEVRVRRLDAVLAELGVTSVHFLKIDVEGFEHQVLEGAVETLQNLPIICMELDVLLPTESCDALAAHDFVMERRDYRCFRFARTKFAVSPLVEVKSRAELISLSDNLVYIPAARMGELPKALFAATS